MDVPTYQQRTRQINASYTLSRDRFGDPSEVPHADLAALEGLMRDTIRQFRENLADCVRSERHATKRILGARRSNDTAIELGYAEAKAELNEAIARVTEEKAQVRARMRRPQTPTPVAPGRRAGDQLSTEQLMTLVDLHTAGVLSADEFASAKARLQ